MLIFTLSIDIKQNRHDILFTGPSRKIDIIIPHDHLKPRNQFRYEGIEELIIRRDQAHNRKRRMKQRRRL